ncbi:hypothetical protein [Aquimarina sp. Aq78]|uniref:hypothetical protein n=1 Tax=Aquimarina sp. Aq78 TaxID=1191889 RepID=UPI000D105E02|nr:hypothetical protein [Aquimarina sp. Aq78]
MKQTSDLVSANIKAFDVANSSPFDGRISPIYAPIEDEYPFCVYRVDRKPNSSKQGLYEYEIQIRIVNTDYDALCDLIDGLTIHFKQYKEFFDQGTESAANPDKTEEYIMTSTYQLFKNN